MNMFISAVCKSTNRYFGTSNAAFLGPAIPKTKKPENYGPMEVQRSVMMNGLRVASAKPLGSQMGACTVMFRSGSRYEWDDQLGASHFVRIGTSGTGRAYSGFAKVKVLQQAGAYLTCTSNRETISFTLRCVPYLFPELKYYLLDTASRCCFHGWELPEWKKHVRGDLARVHPEMRVMDLVQKACWSGPLSQSTFCEEERIDSMDEDSLVEFVNHNFRTDGCSIGSVGIPFDHVLKMSEKIETRGKKCERNVKKPKPRAGYEVYDLGPCSDTWIAVAVPGCGTKDYETLLKYAVVAHACGWGNYQVGQHAHDRSPQHPLSLVAGKDLHTSYKAFNISYHDTGVFGIIAHTHANNAWNAAFAAAEFLANIGELDYNQIEIGKQRLRLAMCLNEDNVTRSSEGLALQAANDIKINSSFNAVSTIDCLPTEETCKVAKKISKRRKLMSLAIVGDLGVVPTDVDIKKYLKC